MPVAPLAFHSRARGLRLSTLLVTLATALVLLSMLAWTAVSRLLIWPDAIRLVERTALERLTVVVAELLVTPGVAPGSPLFPLPLQAALARMQETLALPSGSVRLYQVEQGTPVLWPIPNSHPTPQLSDAEREGVRLALVQGSAAFAHVRAGQALEVCVARLRATAGAPMLLVLEAPQGHFIRFAGPGQLRKILASGLLVALGCMGVAMVVMGGALRQALMPLRQLSEGIQALGGGEQGVRLAARRAPPDIAQLMEHFNRMADQLEERARVLEASERHHRTLFLAAWDAILVIERDPLHLETLNPAAEQLWQQPEGALKARPVWTLLEPEPDAELETFPLRLEQTLLVPPSPAPGTAHDTSDAERRALWTSLLERPFYARVTRPDGSQRRVEVRASLIPQGEQARYMLLCRDVTESLAEWERLLRASRLSSLGLMAGGIAHQLNNPLVGVLNFAQLLARALPAQDERQALVQVIEEGARRCQHIVRSLLDFGRAGEAEVFRRIPVHALLMELERLSEEPLKRFAGRLELIRHEPLPLLWGQPVPLVQALLNLVSNALQASGPGGRVELDVRAAPPIQAEPPGRDEPGQLILEVRDYGPGIPPEVQARLFEPFFTTRPPGEGTGLGLALVERIVRVHHGQLRLLTRAGYGAIFELRLPSLKTTAGGDTCEPPSS